MTLRGLCTMPASTDGRHPTRRSVDLARLGHWGPDKMTTTPTAPVTDDFAAAAVSATLEGQQRGFFLAIKASNLLLLCLSSFFTSLIRI